MQQCGCILLHIYPYRRNESISNPHHLPSEKDSVAKTQVAFNGLVFICLTLCHCELCAYFWLDELFLTDVQRDVINLWHRLQTVACLLSSLCCLDMARYQQNLSKGKTKVKNCECIMRQLGWYWVMEAGSGSVTSKSRGTTDYNQACPLRTEHQDKKIDVSLDLQSRMWNRPSVAFIIAFSPFKWPTMYKNKFIQVHVCAL